MKMGKMTRVPENIGLVVVRRDGDCHVSCARPRGCACGQESRPRRRAFGTETGGLPKVVEYGWHRNSKAGALWSHLWVSSHGVWVYCKDIKLT